MQHAVHAGKHDGRNLQHLKSTAHMDYAVSSRFAELREAVGSIFIDEADLKHVRKLGEGAFATVEECILRGSHVAVKRLKPELFADVMEVNDFLLEGVLIAQVHHPCIVEVKGLGFHTTPDGEDVQTKSLFMAQELCNGGSLRDKVLAQMSSWHKSLYTYADGLRWATQMAQGLAYLHDQEPTIIHRDLKLDNILLAGSASKWDAKIADFGLVTTVRARDRHEKTVHMRNMGGSKAVRDYDPSTGALARSAAMAAQNKTQAFGNANNLKRATMKKVDTRTPPPEDLTGQTGSFLNMAPEVVLSQPYDEKVDIFSLGCCLFEIFSKVVTAAAVAVTGDPNEFEKIAHSVAEGYRRPLPESWPPELKVIVTACMAQNPQDRPSADQIVARLQSPELVQGITAMDGRETQHLHSGGGCCSVQ